MSNKMDQYQQYIGMSRYARFLDDKQRRENWGETVDRYIDYIFSRTPTITEKIELKTELRNAIFNLELMPSMRSVMTAGKSADRDNTCMYNCAYMPVDDPKSFDEAMYVLLCGTGVGFSVETKCINKLPEVPEKLFESDGTISVHDSKEGWAKLARTLKAEIDEDRIEAFRGTVSIPFEMKGRVAIKIIDNRGIESLRILDERSCRK